MEFVAGNDYIIVSRIPTVHYFSTHSTKLFSAIWERPLLANAALPVT